MSHGLLWFPLLLAFVLLAALGWLERRRQSLFRTWAEGAELVKLDGCGGAQLKDGRLVWCRFEAGTFQDCLLYTSPSPRDRLLSRMPSSA